MKSTRSFPAIRCRLLALALAITGFSRADTVTLIFSAGRLFDSAGDSLLPNGTLAILVADTLQNGFGQLQPGSLTVGDFLNGDNQILARGSINNSFFGTGTAGGSVEELELETGLYSQLSPTDALAVIWFAGLTDSSFSFSSGASYGLFTDVNWVVQEGGSTESFEFFTTSRDGSYSDTLGRSNLSAIPEPSTYAAFAGAFLLGFAVWRRRRG